jgi:predicted lipoprotein
MDMTFAAVAARTQRAGMWRRKNTLETLAANIHASHAFMGAD